MTQPYRITSYKDKNILEIAWDPNNVCNFKCHYCFPDSNAATHRSPTSVDLVIDNFRYLMDQYKNKLDKNKFQFVVAGGEPTLWKDLGEFIKKIKMHHDVYFSLITNGSRSLRWWEEYSYVIDNAHITHHIDQGNVEHVIKVADILYEKGTKTTVKVLMDTVKWNQGISDIEYMKTTSKHPWFIMASEVIDQQTSGNTVSRYTKDQLKYLKKDLKRIPSLKWFWKNKHLLKENIRLWESKVFLENGKTVNTRPGTYINKKWNNFKDWDCSIGLDRVYVKWNGNISGSCQSKLFGLNYYYNILETDFKDKFNLPIAKTKCPYNGCWCVPETHISKEKTIEIKSVSLGEYPLHRYSNL
jgi:MoaA/NifB/PqqE/SkfB family radical SAM enzyme